MLYCVGVLACKLSKECIYIRDLLDYLYGTFVDSFYKKVLKLAKMSNFFQNAQNHGFRNFDFRFLPTGKKAAVNYYLYEC